MNDIIRRYYDENVEREWERLTRPYHRLEFETTLSLLTRYLAVSGQIIDIGCGPGRYAIELLKRGYSVTLFDLSSGVLDFAVERMQEQGLVPRAVHQGAAQDLTLFPEACFDALLLMGPMYHIVDRPGRIQALREALRILKPGAPAFIAYLNAWGTLKAGLGEFPGELNDKPALMVELLSEYSQVGEQKGGFTEAFFTTPPTAEGELVQAGFDVMTYAGVEGPASGMQNQVLHLADEYPAAYTRLLRNTPAMSELPQYRDATEHLLFVVRKGEGL